MVYSLWHWIYHMKNLINLIMVTFWYFLIPVIRVFLWRLVWDGRQKLVPNTVLGFPSSWYPFIAGCFIMNNSNVDDFGVYPFMIFMESLKSVCWSGLDTSWYHSHPKSRSGRTISVHSAPIVSDRLLVTGLQRNANLFTGLAEPVRATWGILGD